MSGIEPILIGAALGAGSSAVMGGDPLKGALMGAAGGGIAGGLGGVGSAATAGANTALAPLAGTAGSTIPQTVGASLIEGGTSGLEGLVMEQAGLSGLQYSANPFMAGMQHLVREPSSTLAALGGGFDASKMGQLAKMGGNFTGGKSQQPQAPAPQIKRGQAPQVAGPIMSLMDERQRPQRRRLSLL